MNKMSEEEAISEIEKSMFNSLYGLSVTNNIRDNVIYIIMLSGSKNLLLMMK